MIDILKTLQYMKSDIRVMVWDSLEANGLPANGLPIDLEIDGKHIQYHELETYKPSKEEILAINQALVDAHWAAKEAEQKQETIDDLRNQLNILSQKLNALEGQ